VPTVEERGRRLLAPESVRLLSGTSSVGAGEEREVGLACPGEDGGSCKKCRAFLSESETFEPEGTEEEHSEPLSPVMLPWLLN
jgi:hypothetical protein